MYQNYAVIFDVDGVLADTGPIHYESWVKMANEIGKTFKKSYFEATFGQQSVPITRQLVGRNVDQNLVEKWAQLKEQYYREMVKDKIKPLPGVIGLIEVLKSMNFKLAVGSSGPPENVELILKSLKIEFFFDTIITAAEVKNGKPSPDVFLIAAQKINVKPQNCVVIEDAPVGIEAAKRANMKCIALTTTHDIVDLRIADMIVQDLSYVSVNSILDLLNIKTQ
ncbi:MAG: HAD family phosphatase [Candidatus Lokiarchaeota archaeon]|nr:HAD family phosphatase [Candidatus Lokiarchaeota archaeon]